MSDKIKMMLVGVVSLIVGAAGGGGYGMMQVDDVTQKLVAMTQAKDQATQNADRLRMQSDEATKKYGKELGKLVNAATAPAAAPPAAPAAAPVTGQPAVTPTTADDGAKSIDGARALLAMRDGFRASLDGVRAAMDGELDAMATELGNAAPDVAKIKALLDAAKQNWPEKEKSLQAATQKLLVDLGLAQAPAAPKPAAAPVPAAAAPAEAKK